MGSVSVCRFYIPFLGVSLLLEKYNTRLYTKLHQLVGITWEQDGVIEISWVLCTFSIFTSFLGVIQFFIEELY